MSDRSRLIVDALQDFPHDIDEMLIAAGSLDAADCIRVLIELKDIAAWVRETHAFLERILVREVGEQHRASGAGTDRHHSARADWVAREHAAPNGGSTRCERIIHG